MSIVRRLLTPALLISAHYFALAPQLARADDGGGRTSEMRALERQLDEEQSALSTSDCTAACRAMASIRRAADNICALEPGPRCDAARAKAADAARRVRDACPECALAAAPQPPSPEAASVEAPKKDLAPSTVPVQAAPPAEEPRRGCASCSTTPSGARSDLAVVVGALLVLRRVQRRRR